MSSLFAFIKQQVPIVQEVGRYVRLRSAGSYLKGSCIFHKETDASFTVSPDKGIFYCFGCHATGDVISFIARAENIGPLEAAKHLIETHGLKVPEEILRSSGSHGKGSEERASYFAVHKYVADWAHAQLRSHAGAYEYVRSRGISEGSIDQYAIGYFPSSPRAVQQLLQGAVRDGILAKDLIEAGIFYDNTKSSQLKSPFEDRILFPITDALGRVCGFGGRIFVPNDERAKYYNSKESPFFQKGSLLFGYTNAKKSMQERKAVFLVEGYTDCVLMAQFGYTNTVATLGTACTAEHLQLLARSVERVFVMYDGDAAGRKATLRLAQLCWQFNIELLVISLPFKVDPAAYLARTGTLAAVLPKAEDIFTFFVAATTEEFAQKSLAEKMRIIEDIIEVMVRVTDMVKREILLQQLSGAVGIPLGVLRLRLQEQAGVLFGEQGGQRSSSVGALHQEPMAGPEHDSVEAQVIGAYVHGLQHGVPLTVPEEVRLVMSDRARRCLAVAEEVARLGGDAALFVDAFLQRSAADDVAWLSALLITHGKAPADGAFAMLLQRLLQHSWKEEVGLVRARLTEAAAQGDQDTVEKLLLTFTQLKEKIQKRGSVLWQKK